MFRCALLAALLLTAAPAYADNFTFARGLLGPGDDATGGGAATQPDDTTPTILDTVGAAEPVTLPDLLQLAIRQAPDLERAQIDTEIAEAQVESARAVKDWTLSAEGDASHTFSNRGTGSSTTNGTALKADLTRMFDWGGTFTLHGETDYSRTHSLTVTPLGSYTQDSTITQDILSGTWTEPLLAGRGRDIVLAREAQAAIQLGTADLTKQQSAIAVVRDVVQGYWELVYAQNDLAIRHSSLELARERLRRTQAGISGGGLAKTEALAVEQVIAAREEDVLASELNLVDQSIALRKLVGMEIGPEKLALSTTGDVGVPGKSWNLDELIDAAYKTSPELALLTQQGKGAKIDVDVTENGVLPSLDLAVTLGPVGVSNRPLIAAKNLVTADAYTAFASLTYTASLGNHKATGAAREARATLAKVSIDETDTRAQIAQALTEAVLLAESAKKRIDLAATEIDLAQQNILAEQSRFQLGKSTNFDVLQRQNELEQAQLKQARAIIDWHKAATVIASISGELLGDYGISLK